MGAWWWFTQREAKKPSRATHAVRRGDLRIVVAEGGSLEAMRSEIIKSEVEGHCTIISLVLEGTLISEEDVKQGKILVELDSADLRERVTTQEITHATAKAAYTEAKEGLDIQKSQGESDIKGGELKLKLGLMDLEHYVGRDLAADALDGKADLLKVSGQLYERAGEHRRTVEADIARALAEVERAFREDSEETKPPADASGSPAPGKKPKEAPAAAAPEAPEERLGGEALQKKRDLESSIGLAIEELKRAVDKLVWTAKLEKKGYATRTERETDHLAFKRAVITLQQAMAARELYLRYQFPKEAEKLLSGYSESGRELERVKARARSALSSFEAKLKSSEATFLLQDRRLKKLTEQVEKCMIRAAHPGLVVYASTGDSWRQATTPVEVGASVHERQELIKLPDISSLAAEIKVHESVVDKVKIGQRATVRVDAFPNLVLDGKVNKVGLLASSQNRWMNPDLKQYDTQVRIEDCPLNLKPGMSAKVEIQVDTLKNILMVPVQAVNMRDGKPVIHVLANGIEDVRPVETGEANNEFVEIRSGVREGDMALLDITQGGGVGRGDEERRGDDQKKREKRRGMGEEQRRREPREGERPDTSKRPNATEPKPSSAASDGQGPAPSAKGADAGSKDAKPERSSGEPSRPPARRPIGSPDRSRL